MAHLTLWKHSGHKGRKRSTYKQLTPDVYLSRGYSGNGAGVSQRFTLTTMGDDGENFVLSMSRSEAEETVARIQELLTRYPAQSGSE